MCKITRGPLIMISLFRFSLKNYNTPARVFKESCMLMHQDFQQSYSFNSTYLQISCDAIC
uniref:Uncharacterized protein n=1 Tax=Rhizophora mucronata TaxID=61149 RepID=A0A2P2NKB3_RHIMU